MRSAKSLVHTSPRTGAAGLGLIDQRVGDKPTPFPSRMENFSASASSLEQGAFGREGRRGLLIGAAHCVNHCKLGSGRGAGYPPK
jgi:hypothetical protein